MSYKQIVKNHKFFVDKLTTESEWISKNITLIKNVKNEVVEQIECIKYEVMKLHCTKLHESDEERRKYFPVVIKELILEDLDLDTSLIQNRCDFICNDLKQLKANIDDRIILINKHDFIMNILNYKLYEIQYNFSKKMKQLKDTKKQLENSNITAENESKIAMKFVENEKKITECESSHEGQHKSIRQHMLEAQDAYEKSVNVLDDCVEVMKRNFEILLSLLQAHKHQTSGHSNLEHVLEIDHLKETIETCSHLQENGWKAAPQNLTDFSTCHGMKFTDEGLLITDSGREISYNEAVETKLLHNLNLLDLYRAQRPDDTAPQDYQPSLQASKESSRYTEQKMSSEDVSYLKDCLGTPLTLALAEITAIQPRDPIHYLGHWLFKYRYSEEMTEKQAIEINELTAERERIAREKWKKFIEEEARAAVIDMIVRAEEEAIRKELKRIEQELAAAEEEYEKGLVDETGGVVTPV